jgi:hypothetical protein
MRRNAAVPARRFPLSQEELETYFPDLADHLTLLAAYGCQDAGSPILDSIGAHHLVENQALLYEQAGDPLGRLAVGFDTAATTEFAADTDAAFADLSAVAARTLLVRFACPDNGGVAAAITGAGSGTTAAGWGLRLNAAGRLVARATDGSTPITATTAATLDDGLDHDAAAVWDRLAATPALRVLTEAEAASTNLGALSASNIATGLRIGSIHALAPIVGLRISYAALLAGAMTADDMAAWITEV